MNKVENRALVLTVDQANAISKVASGVVILLLVGFVLVSMAALDSVLDYAPAKWMLMVRLGFVFVLMLPSWLTLRGVDNFLKASVAEDESE